MNTLLTSEKYRAQNDAVAASYFYDAQGKPWPVGHVLKTPECAAVLRLIARRGANGLSQGEVGRAIVDKVQGRAANPGVLLLRDMAGYRAKMH